MEDLKSIETGGNVEDNLSKVEKAYILDYTKNYDDYLNIMYDINSFSNSIVISDVSSFNNNYVSYNNVQRAYGAIGFTVSRLTCENDTFFQTVKPYMIEVPVKDFYNLSNNRIYFTKKDLSYQEQIEDVIQIINDKFPNLKEGEEIIPNGFIIYVPQKADDWGFIIAIKKTSQGYMIKYILNSQVFDEFTYIDEIF